ncbi:hypothetical protein N9250_02845 [bacterium]|nr:hypothetical protein [bacterium]
MTGIRAPNQGIARFRSVYLLLGIAVLALVLRVVVSAELPADTWKEISQLRGGDSRRFARQATCLAELTSFPTTTLPPGYPIFLAPFVAMSISPRAAICFQVFFSVLVPLILYLNLRHLQARLSLILLVTSLFYPWGANYSTRLMSETLGYLLILCFVTALASLISRPENPKTRLFLTGCSGMSACLTCPAATPTVALLIIVLCLSRIFLWKQKSIALLGVMCILMPWQIHCIKMTGRPAYALLHKLPNTTPGFGSWIKTWVIHPYELTIAARAYIWTPTGSTTNYEGIPDRAYATAESRRHIEATATRVFTDKQITAGVSEKSEEAGNVSRSVGKVDVLLKNEAGAIIDQRGRLRSLGTTLIRSCWYWCGMGSLDVFGDAIYRGGAHPMLAIFLHFVHLTFIACAFLPWCFRKTWHNPYAIAVILGILTFTLISGFQAMGEYRRILPLLPLLVLGWINTNRVPQSQELQAEIDCETVEL